MQAYNGGGLSLLIQGGAGLILGEISPRIREEPGADKL